MHRRQPALADLATGTALGLTIGTVAAAVVAEHLGWRGAFAVTAVVAGVLAALLSRLPEPARPAPAAGRPTLRSPATAARCWY